MAGPTPGREAILYYNSGTFGTPTWTAIPRTVDLDWDAPVTWADVASRESLWKFEAKAQQGLTVTFGYRRRQGVSDAVFTAIRGYAFGATTKQELAIADGAIATTGTQYLRATYQFGMGRSEPLEDGAIDNFEAHLAYEEDSGTARAPAWTVV
jgi:hypothetical protein